MIRSTVCEVKAPAASAPQADLGITSSVAPLTDPASLGGCVVDVVVVDVVVVDVVVVDVVVEGSEVVVATRVVVVGSGTDVDVVARAPSAALDVDTGRPAAVLEPSGAPLTTFVSSGLCTHHTPPAPIVAARTTRNLRRPTESMPVP